jgi:hypothetical protein
MFFMDTDVSEEDTAWMLRTEHQRMSQSRRLETIRVVKMFRLKQVKKCTYISNNFFSVASKMPITGAA